MIFVTVGTELPFNRLVQAVDEWAFLAGRNDVFAQIGETDWKPKHIQFSQFIDPREFTERLVSASRIVAHAGMGSILTALNYGKPILVMPRSAALQEHRNDHQLATARRLLQMGRISVAFDEQELRRKLERLEELEAASRISPYADANLVSAISSFIRG
jgi:UDP-N-acetylglucosamine transferase subunit ALG13